MATKPNIYTVNNTSTLVATGGVVPLGSIIRRYCACTLNEVGNAITINDNYSNYYKVTVDSTFTVPTAGNVTLVLQQNGSNVVGATATKTIGTATTEIGTMSFTAIVRATCGCIDDILSVINTGVEATYSNIAVTVEKL